MSQNQIPVEQLREGSSVKKVIGVVSGKGGVGKSSVTGLTAVLANRCGYRTAVMDADITGPSIPKMFGLHQNADSDGTALYPVETENGIKVISLNLLVKNETDPVVWRGPMVANVVKQFWKDVAWGDVDFMMIDMPPGTGDVPLTVFQSIPVDGIIVVASPQDLVGMIVEKAINMANMMNIPIVGLVENMSYLECPDCGEHIQLFGESHIDDIAKEKGLKVLGKLPIQPEFSGRCDAGTIEDFAFDWLDSLKSVFDSMVPQSEVAPSSVPTTKSSDEQRSQTMKIAVPGMGANVAEHFGHCENFHLFEIANNEITASETVPNPGHKPGFLPNFLADKGVTIVLAGGIGGGAIDIFGERGVKVVMGASGNAKAAVEAYLNGTLKTGENTCHENH